MEHIVHKMVHLIAVEEEDGIGGGHGNNAGGGSGWLYTESTYSYWKNNSTEGKSNNWKINSIYYLTSASMSNGQRLGNGEAKITLVN